MREIEVNGVRTAYVEQGSGDPVVLVHGLGGTATDIFKNLIAPLSERHRVVAYDLRGSGRELGHAGAVHDRVARRRSRRPPGRARPRHRDADRPLDRRRHRPPVRGDAPRPRAGGGRHRRRDRPPRAGQGRDGDPRGDRRGQGMAAVAETVATNGLAVVVPGGQPGGAPRAHLAARVERHDRLRGSVSRARRNGCHRATSRCPLPGAARLRRETTRRLRRRRTRRTLR